ncbi:MAG: hypothetical protein QOH29_1717, partial [Actinomycetota bacterium]|nr:hypothetical protein [Actinomycetota bacterium]
RGLPAWVAGRARAGRGPGHTELVGKYRA